MRIWNGSARVGDGYVVGSASLLVLGGTSSVLPFRIEFMDESQQPVDVTCVGPRDISTVDQQLNSASSWVC